jgi:hypothetical protein
MKFMQGPRSSGKLNMAIAFLYIASVAVDSVSLLVSFRQCLTYVLAPALYWDQNKTI